MTGKFIKLKSIYINVSVKFVIREILDLKYILFAFMISSLSASAQGHNYMLTGSYTNSKSKGIHVYDFNSSNGSSGFIDSASTSNPTYLAVSPDQKFVLAVNEDEKNGQGGKIVSYAFDKKTGHLTEISQAPSGGDAPCYITVDKTGKWVITGNYSTGTLSVLSLDKNGKIKLMNTIHHQGHGVNKGRQEGPHVHCTYLSPDNKYLLVADLGIDKVMIYAFDQNTGSLKPASQPFVKLKDGSGPRHIIIHPNGKWAYLANELAATATAFNYNNGSLKIMQTISTLPKDFKGPVTSADIHISPDNKFLYVSNRDNSNTIAIFRIDQKTGKLSNVGFQSTLGNTPRNFSFDPSGNFLIVANQNTDNIVIFKINRQTGMLTLTDNQISIGKPVCIKWVTK